MTFAGPRQRAELRVNVRGATEIRSVAQLRQLAGDASVRSVELVSDASTPREDISFGGRYNRYTGNPDGSVGGFVHESSTVGKGAYVGKSVIIGYDSHVVADANLKGEASALIRRGTIHQMNGYE
ncbi:MAG: hypothetical protein KGH64_03730 [Candidatus Micrarchaeota archaeon]|nr:hypothetical protein [Candidatus Micrarchaeota archaeon]MDE1859892.1 hypothetical protein [Candidatus Micrarchaeota archaeon]